MRKILREYWIELVGILVVLLGIFLLFEQLEIRVAVYHWFVRVFNSLQGSFKRILDFFHTYISDFTLSDLVGWLLILTTGVFFAWRFRYRFMHSQFYIADECPKCKGKLHRVHRSWRDHFLSQLLFLPLHRYRCSNHACGWEGLRRPIRERRKSSSSS